MRLIDNTNEIKVGDIILGIPYELRMDKETYIENHSDGYFKIIPKTYDVESFSEEIRIAKCIMIDEQRDYIHLVDIKNGDTFTWNIDTKPTNDYYSVWILDLKF